jgi:copper homeostasis protein
MGFDWVLTSGQQKTAEIGIPLLKELTILKKDKIKILAGGGINVNNCRAFEKIGIDGIHFSIDKYNKIEKNKIKEILNQLSVD